MAEKQWYDKNMFISFLFLLSGVVWLPIYGGWCLFTWDSSQDSKPKWLRWWGNRVDNFPDLLKEWIHCHDIPFTDKHINISRWMRNRTDFGKLIRPNRDPDGNCWSNCDPEDCQECKYMIEHMGESKWPEICPMCGRETKK